MTDETDEHADSEPAGQVNDAATVTPRPADLKKITGDFDKLAKLGQFDFTKIAGVDHDKLGQPDFTKIAGVDHDKLAKLGQFDFTKIAGVDHDKLAKLGQFDFTKIAGVDHDKLGQFDFTKIAGSADFARLAIGNVDFSLLRGLDFSKFTGGVEFDKLTGGIDLSAFQGVDFGKLFKDLNLDFDLFYPPNWPADLDLDVATVVINDDGIPLVWVPRQAVVEQLVAALDRPARITVLLEHAEELVGDCRLVLAEVTNPTLTGQLPLARQAVEAFGAGHREAAQALATVVTETVIADAVSKKYDKVKEVVFFDPDRVPWNRLRLAAALGPIYRFYTSWWKSSGNPPPEELSRHVTVHNADVTHYSPGNALVAILLVTSVLRGIQEQQENGSP